MFPGEGVFHIYKRKEGKEARKKNNTLVVIVVSEVNFNVSNQVVEFLKSIFSENVRCTMFLKNFFNCFQICLFFQTSWNCLLKRGS
jgi:hypothetical protein